MMKTDATASTLNYDNTASTSPDFSVEVSDRAAGDDSGYDQYSSVPDTTVSFDLIDGQEQNPEIIRSEMMFYSTPLTEKYAEAAYGAIQNIQAMCAMDYQSICPTSSPYMNLNYLMGELMTPMLFSGDNVYRRRRLHEARPAVGFKSGAEYVAYLRSFYSARFLPSFAHPLANVMYLDKKTNQFLSPSKEREQEKSLRGAGAGEKQKEKPTISSKPRSYLAGLHHNHMQIGDTHRRLRMAAPGFVYPSSHSAPAVAAAGEESAVDAMASEQSASMPQPCTVGMASDASPDAGDAGLDFRKFVLDFLNGRDVSVSLVGPYGFAGSAGGNVDFVNLRLPLSGPARDDDSDDASYNYDDSAAADDDSYYYADDGAQDDGDAYYYYDDDAAVSADDDSARDIAAWQPLARPSPLLGMAAPRMPQLGRPLFPVGVEPAALMRPPHDHGDRDHHDHDHHDHDHHDRVHHDGPTEGSGESSQEGGESGEHGGWSWGHSPSSEGSGSSSSEEGGWFGGGGKHGRDHQAPPPPPPPPVPEDHSFDGSLGFGADGDMCLYKGMADGRVSDPCIDAVADLYELRAEYWQESQQPQGHHHGGFFLLLVLAVLVGCLARRFLRCRHDRKVRSLLTALHTHPALKAAVEAETGVTVPEPVPHLCGARQQGGGRCSQSAVMRFAKVTAMFIGLLVLSFWLSFAALEITMHVVHGMDEHAPTDPTGEPQYTSPVAAMAILLLVITAEITAVALVFRGLKACCCPAAAPAADGSTSAPSPSLFGQVADYAQRLAGFGGSSSQYGPDGYYSRLPSGEEAVYEAPSPAPAARSRFSAPAAVTVGTEMVSMSRVASAPPMQQAHAAPHQQQQRYAAVLVPVTAMPVNSVSMV